MLASMIEWQPAKTSTRCLLFAISPLAVGALFERIIEKNFERCRFIRES
jgi:hypothetical protein